MASGGVSGIAVGTVAVGSLLIWSGVKGVQITRTIQSLIKGEKPQATPDYPVATPQGSTTSQGDKTASTPGPGGTVIVDGVPVAAWLAALIQYARAHGWTGKVTSGYRSYEDQVRVYNSGVRPAARPGASHHQGTAYPDGAIDVTPPMTGPASLVSIVRGSGLQGATEIQAAGAKDPVHISIPGSHRPGEGTY